MLKAREINGLESTQPHRHRLWVLACCLFDSSLLLTQGSVFFTINLSQPVSNSQEQLRGTMTQIHESAGRGTCSRITRLHTPAVCYQGNYCRWKVAKNDRNFTATEIWIQHSSQSGWKRRGDFFPDSPVCSLMNKHLHDILKIIRYYCIEKWIIFQRGECAGGDCTCSNPSTWKLEARG